MPLTAAASQTQTAPRPARAPLETPARSFGCAWIADLPSWAVKRLEPKARDGALVVIAGRRVIGACSRARRAGVRIGDALTRARSLCPEAAISQLEPSTLSAAWDSALSAMNRVTPWLESVRPGIADLAGITALDGEALASDLDLRIGIASTRSGALLAALANLHEVGARVVKDEVAFLSRYPVYLLGGAGIAGETIERLKLFGLKTIGDLQLRVSQQQLETQFKQDGRLLWSLMTAGDARPVALYTPPVSVSAVWAFETAVLEPFETAPILELLVRQCVAALGSRYAGTVTVTLHTALGDSVARQLMNQYSLDPKTLLNVASRCLNEAHAGLEIERITVLLSDLLKPLAYQEHLFGALERKDVREAISVVHQHFPDRIGRLEIVRANAPLKEQRFRFAPLDGLEPRIKRKSTSPATAKGRSRKQS